jgi:hypothetical protein
MPPEGSDLIFDHRHNAADRALALIVMIHSTASAAFCGTVL